MHILRRSSIGTFKLCASNVMQVVEMLNCEKLKELYFFFKPYHNIFLFAETLPILSYPGYRVGFFKVFFQTQYWALSRNYSVIVQVLAYFHS